MNMRSVDTLQIYERLRKARKSTVIWIIGWVSGMILTQTGFLAALR